MQPELHAFRDEILYTIDHLWMVEDPDTDEYAFLFRCIQERHRTQFEQAFQQTDVEEQAALTYALNALTEQRDRAEEILYWLYRDTELRKLGKTLPDECEQSSMP